MTYMAEGKNKIIFYKNWGKTFNQLTDEEAGKLIKHFCAYVNDENPELTDRYLNLAWVQMEDTLKRDLRKWNGFIDKQSVNGSKGGRPKNSQITQAFSEKAKKAVKVMVKDKVMVKVMDKDMVKDNVKEKRESVKFAHPGLEDVILAMQEKLDHYTAKAEAENFINYYQANGWMVGKSKMKDWRAAVRGWVARMREFKPQQKVYPKTSPTNVW